MRNLKDSCQVKVCVRHFYLHCSDLFCFSCYPILYISSDLVKPIWMYNLIILISTLVFFLLPMLIISVLYLLIGLRLRRERVLTTVDTNCGFGSESISSSHNQRLSKRNVQVTKMLCRCYFTIFLF